MRRRVIKEIVEMMKKLDIITLISVRNVMKQLTESNKCSINNISEGVMAYEDRFDNIDQRIGIK